MGSKSVGPGGFRVSPEGSQPPQLLGRAGQGQGVRLGCEIPPKNPPEAGL